MLRPKYHFTPEKGWINDPNGPVFYKGKYHLFYQHDPNSLVWDRMHWGHAISDDLLTWKHLPIVLFPDETGDIYSGSAVVDKENVSGLGSKGDPALLVFYTSHHMETKREQQCLAFSRDGLTYTKYEGNPIIPGKEHTPARDPHVIANPVLGGFTMTFTKEDRVVFYHSEDLIHWDQTGEFIPSEKALTGMIECPCMFPCRVEGESAPESSRYVLILSMDIPEEEFFKLPEDCVPHKRLMQYFVGDFDGEKFVLDKSYSGPLIVDNGPDFYAGTIFSNVVDPILISWLGDFSEGARIPMEKEGFRGVMSYPRKLQLGYENGAYFLKQEFYPDPNEISRKYPADPDVSYVKEGIREILRDHCVEETIADGKIAHTRFVKYNR
ncbi:MAG: glycoside hydrolase family 32 protein [Clostridiales bacterium]|nr:glycoside hydrolase family 32 protein [Clostridiales bacterium]